MKDTQKLIPNRRFREFMDDGAWEKRKLLERVEKVIDFRGRTPKKLGMDWSDTGYLALSALNVKNGFIDPSVDAHYGDQVLYETWMAGNELHKGQVLFTTEAPMGNVAQVPDDNRYILSQRTIAFEVKKELITENYLAVVLGSPNSFADLTALCSGGTAKGVSQKSLSGFHISVPRELEEQEKIATLFQSLDNLITHHQRKLEKIKNFKSAYLSKMFPKEGEKYPELRFAGFTDAWEQRQLGELYDSVESGNRLPKNMLNEGTIPYVIAKTTDNGILMRIDEGTSDYHGNKMKMFCGGSITFSIDNPEAIFLQNEPFYTSNIMRVLYKKEYNSNHSTFILESLKKLTNNYNWSLKFSGPVVMNSSILLPLNGGGKVNWIEVEAIGQVIKSLDNLITLHQRKLAKLKSIKQAYLNEMFV